MVSDIPCLWLQELGDTFVSSLNSVKEMSVLCFLVKCLSIVMIIFLKSFSTFHCLDLLLISIPIQENYEEVGRNPPMSIIIEAVWLVVVWEYAHVLVSQLRSLALLKSPLDSRVFVLLRIIEKCWIYLIETMGEWEHAQPSCLFVPD